MIKIRHKTIFFLFLLLINWCYTQNKDSKIRIFSVSAGFGGFYFNETNSEGGGASFVLNGTLVLNKNLVNLCFLTGSEIGVVGSSTYNFNEFSVAYGKALQLKRWFNLEGFAGIGNYNQSSKNSTIISGNTLSFPLKLNFKFFFNKKMGMGLENTYSINSLNNNLSTNLIIHYNF